MCHGGAHVRLVGGVIRVTEAIRVSDAGLVVPPEHGELFDGAGDLLLGWGLSWSVPHLVQGMDKVTPGTVWAEPDTVVGATEVCLVFRVSRHCPQLVGSVSKLTLLSVLAGSIFLKGPTHLGLVS